MPNFLKIGFFLNLTAVMVVIFMSCPAMSKQRIEIVPMVVVAHTYDDNIYLIKTNRESDHITTISPTIRIKVESEKDGLSLTYYPTWARYHEHSEHDTLRHTGSLSYRRGLSEHLDLVIEDQYLKSERPLEETFEPDVERAGVRHTRDMYQRNRARASLDYQYGPNDHFIIGYVHQLLENDDPFLDDSTEQGPFVALSHWFDVRNGVDLNYAFTMYRDDPGEEAALQADDYDGHDASVRFIHRFGPRTRANARYAFAFRDFRVLPKEYQVHTASLGVAHDISEHTSVSLDGGIYIPEGDITEGSGPFFNARLTRRIEHGSIVLGVSGGWREDYMDAEQGGFAEYMNFNGKIDYRLQENLSAYAGLSFGIDRDYLQIDKQTYEGRCGLSYEIPRWFSLGLDYTYRNHTSDNPDDEYVDNRIMLTLTGFHEFRWGY